MRRSQLAAATVLSLALALPTNASGSTARQVADALPSFFPGHEAGSSHHHVKHGLDAFILGVGAFIFAWFQTGPATAGRSPSTG